MGSCKHVYRAVIFVNIVLIDQSFSHYIVECWEGCAMAAMDRTQSPKFTDNTNADMPNITIYVTIFAAECLKMKLLIEICTVLCRI